MFGAVSDGTNRLGVILPVARKLAVWVCRLQERRNKNRLILNEKEAILSRAVLGLGTR